MITMSSLLAIIIAYLFGSLSSAVIVCKLFGLPDPRTQGSKNPGATNVLRIGGKLPAMIVLLGDVLKGVIPVLLANWYGMQTWDLAWVALAAILGHLFPLFFRFQGGKGVATALGGMIALSIPTALCWGATWITVALLFRYASLASIIASLLAPIYFYYFTHEIAYSLAFSLVALILIVRHKSNIINLYHGKEGKLGEKKLP